MAKKTLVWLGVGDQKSWSFHDRTEFQTSSLITPLMGQFWGDTWGGGGKQNQIDAADHLIFNVHYWRKGGGMGRGKKHHRLIDYKDQYVLTHSIFEIRDLFSSPSNIKDEFFFTNIWWILAYSYLAKSSIWDVLLSWICLWVYFINQCLSQ